jgi:hypothetical protein
MLALFRDSRQLFAEFPAKNFSRRGFGNHIKEMHFARLLVVREAIGHERAKLLLEFAALDESISQGHECHRDLAGVLARTADYSALFHRRMLKQHRLDFGRCNRESLVLNHLFPAIDDAIETLTIARDDVS